MDWINALLKLFSTDWERNKFNKITIKHRKGVIVVFCVLLLICYFFILPIYQKAKIANFHEYTLDVWKKWDNKFEKVIDYYIDKPIVITWINLEIKEDNDSVICIKNRFNLIPKEDGSWIWWWTILWDLYDLKNEELKTQNVYIKNNLNESIFDWEKNISSNSTLKLVIPIINKNIISWNFNYKVKISYFDANTKSNNYLEKEWLVFNSKIDMDFDLLRNNNNYNIVHITPLNTIELQANNVKLAKNEKILWHDDFDQKLLTLEEELKIKNYSDIFIKGDFEWLNNKNINFWGRCFIY